MWKNKFKKEREEIETMENLNRVLLENVLPAHVAEHFLARSLKNEVRRPAAGAGGWAGAGRSGRDPDAHGPANAEGFRSSIGLHLAVSKRRRTGRANVS